METNIDDVLAILERTPRTVMSLLSGLSTLWLHAREQPGTFSPHEVVAHLVHGEETDWIPRVVTILEHGDSEPFAPFNRLGFLGKYDGTPIDDLLRRFAELRERSLSHLRALDLEAAHLALRGRHPEFGPVTLAQLLSAWVVHDLGHLFQIARVMAKQYREAAGPWRRYLRILEL